MSYGIFPNFRGPQEQAQDRTKNLPTPNDGNPNGANNMPVRPARDLVGNDLFSRHYRRNSDAPGYAASRPRYENEVTGPVDAAGQHEDLGRYVPPGVRADGSSTQQGAYSYNLPNAYGGQGIMQGMPNFAGRHESRFNPFSRGGPGSQGPQDTDYAQIIEMIRREVSNLRQPPQQGPGTQQGGLPSSPLAQGVSTQGEPASSPIGLSLSGGGGGGKPPLYANTKPLPPTSNGAGPNGINPWGFPSNNNVQPIFYPGPGKG